MRHYNIKPKKLRKPPAEPPPPKEPCREAGCRGYALYGHQKDRGPRTWRCEVHWKGSIEGQAWMAERMREALDDA